MNKAPFGQVRIISGNLRGSKLPVETYPGLRPTSDRVRETLFNWLQSHISGRRILDCFAGTGALGFEAASRGAAEVVLLEKVPALAASLRETAARLKADTVRVETSDSFAWLGRPATTRFDLVFIDPPFGTEYAQQVLPLLGPWLADQAWVYVETGRSTRIEVPSTYQLHREGSTREVWYRLFRHDTATLSPSSPEQSA
ncbi:MAG TPA: 16S rRNA (guanine(966)-N(2))-methyltransferase RsmD [Arenimonas sp.]|nr:16S rRNA (guanine(966)-N(2))-methyltransferase RsmD [Arenimonas sp.]HOZ05282.1 16S rRNA (guanine(966)-N(2))-methyltransferase RsmD [Arenimonas sp.]HPW31818.1 16S rRNA (guanine(966)-N(2))-methyltransferase RsmD [Arenimonas sp.]